MSNEVQDPTSTEQSHSDTPMDEQLDKGKGKAPASDDQMMEEDDDEDDSGEDDDVSPISCSNHRTHRFSNSVAATRLTLHMVSR